MEIEVMTLSQLILVIITAILSSSTLTVMITNWFNRRKTASESVRIDSEAVKINTESVSLNALTIRTFQEIYQDLLKDQTGRITRLEAEQTVYGTRIIGLEKLVEEQRGLIASLRAEIAQLKEQLVSLGHVPRTQERD